MCRLPMPTPATLMSQVGSWPPPLGGLTERFLVLIMTAHRPLLLCARSGITNVLVDKGAGQASNGACAVVWVTQNQQGVYRSTDGRWPQHHQGHSWPGLCHAATKA